ncbi:MAG TPA: hypothetical protein ENI62_13930 [Gammaproteobacteria bacterium]|nr:hypothetical protein [Gammaproteobacteria bacterium]
MNHIFRLLSATFGLTLYASTALALGPIDGELGTIWWANSFQANNAAGNYSAGGYGIRGNLWLDNRWGLNGTMLQSDLNGIGLDSNNHYSFDIQRRIFSLSDNSYIALGLGWEQLNLANDSSAGSRLQISGRISLLGIAYLYGRSTWLPQLSDFAGYQDVSGTEHEAGISITPFPFLSLRAGYRRFSLDFTNATGLGDSTESNGFILGAGFHW